MEFFKSSKSFNDFQLQYKRLPDYEKNAVLSMLQHMEHIYDIKEIDIKRGIDYARIIENDNMTEKELISLITEEFKRQKNIQGEYDCTQTFNSMLKRNSMNSSLFPIALKILGIDKEFIIEQSIYYQQKMFDLEWLYSTLSSRNQTAIYCLIDALVNKEEYIAMRNKPINNFTIETSIEELPFA